MAPLQRYVGAQYFSFKKMEKIYFTVAFRSSLQWLSVCALFFRPAKEAAVETIAHLVILTPFREPSTPQNIPETPCWTPGSESTSPSTPLVTDIVDAYNSAMDAIANLTA